MKGETVEYGRKPLKRPRSARRGSVAALSRRAARAAAGCAGGGARATWQESPRAQGSWAARARDSPAARRRSECARRAQIAGRRGRVRVESSAKLELCTDTQLHTAVRGHAVCRRRRRRARRHRGCSFAATAVWSDELRAESMAVYGGPAATPNFARLAADGTAFTNAFSTYPVSIPRGGSRTRAATARCGTRCVSTSRTSFGTQRMRATQFRFTARTTPWTSSLSTAPSQDLATLVWERVARSNILRATLGTTRSSRRSRRGPRTRLATRSTSRARWPTSPRATRRRRPFSSSSR